MEPVSATRQRGRPPLLSPETVAAYRARGVRGVPRTYQNAAYGDRARRVLGLDGPLPPASPLRWLADPEAAARGERRAVRQTILAELGRIPDVEPLPLGRSVERPACPACHGRGWTYVDVGGDLFPVRVPCRVCGQVAVEELAGDVNEHGAYVMDGDRHAA